MSTSHCKPKPAECQNQSEQREDYWACSNGAFLGATAIVKFVKAAF